MLSRLIKLSVLTVAAVAAASVHAETKLLANIFFPPGHFIQQVMHDWAADVDKATSGEVKIEFAAGNLAPPPQQLQGAAGGIFDIAMTANIFIKNKAPLLQMSSLPWLISDAEAASVAFWRIYEKHFKSKKQFPDVHLLSLFHFTGGHLYSLSDTPINSIDELRSRKMWALPGDAANLLKNMGMSPITSPAVKVSESVSRGVVEGYYGISLESAVDFKASPYTKVITLFPLASTSTNFSLFINKRKWAKLSKENQAAVASVSGEKLSAAVGRAANKAASDALAAMKKDGIKTVDVDPAFYEALQEAAEKSYADYEGVAAKVGLDGKAMIADYKALYQSLEKK